MWGQSPKQGTRASPAGVGFGADPNTPGRSEHPRGVIPSSCQCPRDPLTSSTSEARKRRLRGQVPCPWPPTCSGPCWSWAVSPSLCFKGESTRPALTPHGPVPYTPRGFCCLQANDGKEGDLRELDEPLALAPQLLRVHDHHPDLPRDSPTGHLLGTRHQPCYLTSISNKAPFFSYRISKGEMSAQDSTGLRRKWSHAARIAMSCSWEGSRPHQQMDTAKPQEGGPSRSWSQLCGA